MIIENITDEEFCYVDEQLIAYNSQKTHLKPDKVFEGIYKCVKEDVKILGGISGTLELTSVLHVEILWLDDSVRGKNIGTSLLKALENEAVQKGAALSYLETFDFQAKDFYVKNGYEVFSSLQYPNGNTLYFMKKDF